jgi:molybdopterin synthase sulfur carrier subunit
VATVVLPRSLVALFPGAERRCVVPGATVAEVVAALEARVPGIADRLLAPGPAIRRHLNVFVDGEQAGLTTPVRPDAMVHVIPAVSGG